MLGSATEADDAVQETWLRLSRTDAAQVENLGAWLTTVVARVCLNMLRSRRSRREDSLDVHLEEPIGLNDSLAGTDPAEQAELADSVGMALLVVLDTLTPAERLAFVLHDMFGVPFDEIAPIVDRSPEATRQLASRARRRVRGQAPGTDADLRRQRVVVDAFVKAAREGDFEGLLAILDPDVVLRAELGVLPAGAPRTIRGRRGRGQGGDVLRPPGARGPAGRRERRRRTDRGPGRAAVRRPGLRLPGREDHRDRHRYAAD